MKAELIIKNHVQDVGYKLFVMQRILESPLQGGTINQPDGSVKVLLEGKKEDILEFVERLKKEFPELAKNPQMLGPKFDENLIVPDEMKLSQSLQLDQFGKAVVFLGKMRKESKYQFQEMNSKLDTLPKRLAEELDKKFTSLENNLPKKIAEELDKKFSSMNNKLDTLPKRIAEEINKGELPKRIAEEMSKVLQR